MTVRHPRFIRRRCRRAATVALAAVLSAALGATLAPSATAPAVGAPAGKRAAECRLSAKLVPTCPGALAGAFVAPHPGESYPQAVTRFEAETERRAQIVHYYYTGDRLFPSADEARSLETGPGRRLLLANWKPDTGYTWAAVARGAADDRLIREARYLKQHWPYRMYLAVHHEPENEVQDWAGSGYTAKDYRSMFRHVVDVFRDQGADNVVWVMNYMGAQKWALEDWYDELWPGRRWVDWIAFDPYKTAGLGGQEGGFDTLVNQYWGQTAWRGAYRWARENHPLKPMMLAEWGVGERAGDAEWKADFFRSIPARLERFPRLRALVYFDNDSADVAGNVSVDTTSQSLAGFRSYLADGTLARIG